MDAELTCVFANIHIFSLSHDCLEILIHSYIFSQICSTSAPTPAELIGHLETHGLKIYQCTWCVFGADNESQLLEHASALHPTRRPKAYLRIITNKVCITL